MPNMHMQSLNTKVKFEMKFLILLSTVLGILVIGLYLIRLLLLRKRINRIRRELNRYKEFFGPLLEELLALETIHTETIKETAIKRIVLEIASRRKKMEQGELIRELNLFVDKITVSDIMNMHSEEKGIFRNIQLFVKLRTGANMHP